MFHVEQSEDEHCEVFPENWDSVMMFLACGTCWRRQFAGQMAILVYDGLIRTDVEATIRNLGHSGKKAKAIFADVLVMESAALPILNKPK